MAETHEPLDHWSDALPARIREIVAQAEQRFGAAAITRRVTNGPNIEARAWAMREIYAEGFGIQEIADTFATTTAAVKAILYIPPATEVDDDENDDVPVHKPARMLPMHGERRPCANESECLGELLRACAPKAPRYASCPPNCAAHVPPEPCKLPSSAQWTGDRFPAVTPHVQCNRKQTSAQHQRRPKARVESL